MAADFGNGPLDGIRVLDLSNVIMGPYATRILADMGADVIKIEAPEGDLVRHIHPRRRPGHGGSFLQLNRNKRSIVLDLKKDAARAALRRLVRGADVFLHALRPKTIARLGFDADSVLALNPDIVHCGAYGFGAAGPYADKAAYDDVIQAGSGLAALCGEVSGAPSYVPTVVCDKLAGQAIAYAVLAGLLQRARGGGGQAIEVPMFETAIEFLTPEHFAGAAFDPPLGRFGYGRVLSAGRRPYRTRDGHACILPYSDRNWRDFFDFIGRPEMKEIERFHTVSGRARHVEELYALVAGEAPKRTNAEWVAFLRRRQHPLHAGDALRGPLRRPARARGRPVRYRRAPDRGPPADRAPPRELRRRAVPAAPPRPGARRAHPRGSRGSRPRRERHRRPGARQRRLTSGGEPSALPPPRRGLPPFAGNHGATWGNRVSRLRARRPRFAVDSPPEPGQSFESQDAGVPTDRGVTEPSARVSFCWGGHL